MEGREEIVSVLVLILVSASVIVVVYGTTMNLTKNTGQVRYFTPLPILFTAEGLYYQQSPERYVIELYLHLNSCNGSEDAEAVMVEQVEGSWNYVGEGPIYECTGSVAHAKIKTDHIPTNPEVYIRKMGIISRPVNVSLTEMLANGEP